jgi:peptidylprolyl isomerase
VNFRHLKAAGVALALALALGLTGCTGDADSDPTDTEAPTDSASPEPEASPTPEATQSAEPTTDPTAEPSESPTPEIPASSSLDGVQVAGEPGTKPTVTVPFPWAIDRSQNVVLDAGTGALVLPGDIVRVDYLGVNGRTGEVFDNSYDRGAPAAFPLNGVVAGFSKGLTGQRVGSRVLMAMPSADGYGDTGNGDTILGGDSLVFVAEIKATSRTGVSGAAAVVPDGLPQVTGDPKPAVTLPATAQRPDATETVTVIKGDGPEVAALGQLQVNYVEYAWTADTLSFVRQTYGTGAGPVSASLSGATVPAWANGLVGQTEGSRVLIVAPPVDAYPNGDDTLGVPSGAHSVWVVDILFVV